MSIYLIFCNLQTCFDIRARETARYDHLLLHNIYNIRTFVMYSESGHLKNTTNTNRTNDTSIFIPKKTFLHLLLVNS